jgi:hypothetical protein
MHRDAGIDTYPDLGVVVVPRPTSVHQLTWLVFLEVVSTYYSTQKEEP